MLPPIPQKYKIVYEIDRNKNKIYNLVKRITEGHKWDHVYEIINTFTEESKAKDIMKHLQRNGEL